MTHDALITTPDAITWPKCQFRFGFTSLSIASSLVSSTHTLSLTHSHTLVRRRTHSPLSDQIANARQLVTRSLVGRAFPCLMSFILHHLSIASATPPVTVPPLSLPRHLLSIFCPKPSARVCLSCVDTGRGEYHVIF